MVRRTRMVVINQIGEGMARSALEERVRERRGMESGGGKYGRAEL